MNNGIAIRGTMHLMISLAFLGALFSGRSTFSMVMAGAWFGASAVVLADIAWAAYCDWHEK